MSDQPITVVYGGWCRICGTEDNCVWRDRSRMTLCDSCNEETPQKARVEEFCQITGLDQNEPGFNNWWEDYKYSEYGDVAEYWNACSAQD